jgi:hypothetical protein
MRLILLGKMVQKKKKKDFCATFGHFGAPPNEPKKILKVPQVGGISRLVSDLNNKPLTKSLDPFFWEKRSETTRKQLFHQFLVIFGTNEWLFWPIG